MRNPKYDFADFVGNKFGRLRVIQGEKIGGRRKLRCMCDCGKETVVAIEKVATGHTQSCGCYRMEVIKEASLVHGKSKTRLHKIWRDMQSRCYTPSDYHYEWWGARGIKVCGEWLGRKNGFISFYNWAISNGYKDNLTIDRKNNDGDYSPDNCRWTTILEQSHNRGISKHNKSGISGVHFDKPSGKWRASITNNYRRIYLGRYETLGEAAMARKDAEVAYWNK